MEKFYVGIDASLNGTGLALLSLMPAGHRLVETRTLEPPKGLVGTPRLVWLRDNFLLWLRSRTILRVEGIGLEAYSYGSTNQAHQMGEWGGVLRTMIYEMGLPLRILSPNGLKKFATGKGNTPGKAPVILALFKQTGLDLSHSDNETDAAWLAFAAMEVDQPGTLKLSQPRRDALEKFDLQPMNRAGRRKKQ